ncbi:phosphotransferase [Streptomyces otsuchiensis]|uniref:phosphotransferase n=1 Tax=Streptomyces otsuchiensis TaxID=2681388 RepID=UPI0010312A5A|nr:phosphotransferase [Streptomyces otsuchiensis]
MAGDAAGRPGHTVSGGAAPDAARFAARIAAGAAEELPGRGLNASYRLSEAGARYAVKVHCPERSRAVEARRIRHVDTLLRGEPWYPPLLDLAVVSGGGHDSLVVVRPYAPGTASEDARGQLPALLDVLAALARAGEGTDADKELIGDYATPWLEEPERERERLAPHLTGAAGALAEAVDAHLPQARAAATRLTRTGTPAVHHGDLHGRNLITHERGRLTVIDWDEAGLSRRPADAAKALWLTCRRGRGDFVLDPAAVRDFLHRLEERAGVPRVLAPELARLGALWFVPRAEHVELLVRRGAELAPWYLEWVGRFWSRFAENTALVAAVAREPGAAREGR